MDIPLMAETILGIKGLRFVEPTFADLADDIWTDLLVAAAGEQGRLLVDEKEDPVALAIGDGVRWNAGSFIARRPQASIIDRFEETVGEIWQEKRSVWTQAVREYFSHEITRTVEPALEDQNPKRPEMVDALVRNVWNGEAPGTCLDCCCGSGIGSVVLRSLGFSPLSYDNDSSLLALGLAKSRLLPTETMMIDGAVASQYTGKERYGLGLMFGEINAFTISTWEQITAELLALSEVTLITVGTEKEGKMVEEWAVSRGRSVNLFENRRDPIYDRWVLDIRKD